MTALFGPAGQCDKAREKKLKSTLEYLEYLKSVGLHAFEYSCGRGVNIGEQTAKKLGERAKQLGISLSLHAPYYISLASLEEEKRKKSVDHYLYQSALTVDHMGGTRIVVHPGGLNKQTRGRALEVAVETLRQAQQYLDAHGLSHIVMCPETMGKICQLGDLDEVIALCKVDDRMLPCVDFGHMNARTLGALDSKEAYAALLDKLEQELGSERVRRMHVHFSQIEYSAGGEVRHLTFSDNKGFGPDYQPLMELFAQRGISPTVICESAGTQSQDALTMQESYRRALSEFSGENEANAKGKGC